MHTTTVTSSNALTTALSIAASAPVQELEQPHEHFAGPGLVREHVRIPLRRKPRHQDRLAAGVLADSLAPVPDTEARALPAAPRRFQRRVGRVRGIDPPRTGPRPPAHP